MESVEEFLAYAIKLEQEAALRFGQLADAMATAGNREVMELFRRLSEYSRESGPFRVLDTLRPPGNYWCCRAIVD
jgi:hypothetical protein